MYVIYTVRYESVNVIMVIISEQICGQICQKIKIYLHFVENDWDVVYDCYAENI